MTDRRGLAIGHCREYPQGNSNPRRLREREVS